MSSKELPSLTITGSILEVPPPKEMTVPRPIDKKKISPLDHTKRNSATVLTASKVLKPVNRSISQMSTQTSSLKKNSVASLHGTEEHAKNEEELKKLKKRIEELENLLKTSQKSNKEKDKLIDELNRKLSESNQKEQNFRLDLNEFEKLIESLRAENDSLHKQIDIIEKENKFELEKAKEKFQLYKQEKQDEIRCLNEEHSKEIKIREDKLENLKKQIAGAFKDNSWERQLQIDELTKELKRVQEESELIKHKLKGYKNKYSDSCDNCESMHQKLEEKTVSLREKDNLVNDLINLMKKFQNQLNFNDELIKIVSSNKTLNESLTKLSFSLKHGPTNSIKVKK